MADISTIARPYAKALFDLASSERTLPAWSAALAAAAAVTSDAQARGALANPGLDDQQRAEFVGSVVSALPGGELFTAAEGKNLLRLLAENDRLVTLPEIAAQFDALKTAAENKAKVTVTSAAPIDDAQAADIKKSLERKLGRAVELTLAVDASLIGGAVIQADDMVIDGSVRSRLQRLADTLVG
jgi:F-type H+-transporting ATPase subunit delta